MASRHWQSRRHWQRKMGRKTAESIRRTEGLCLAMGWQAERMKVFVLKLLLFMCFNCKTNSIQFAI